MGISLIEQYCSAIERWAEITRQNPYDLIFYTMAHCGGFWYVQPEGAVEDPYAPEHRGKTVGEVRGRYTLEQLRAHLEYLANDVRIPQDTLICGLICSVERELTSLVAGYKPGLERMREQAEELLHMYEHPDEYSELIEVMERERQKRGRESLKPEDFLHMAGFFWKMLSKQSDDEEAQRKSWLAAWKRVTAPILEHDNLEHWCSEYIAGITGWMPT
jgi:hypothetical protein